MRENVDLSDKGHHPVVLTPRVAAMYCHVSKSTVLKWVKDGKLKAFRLSSKRCNDTI